ncbi:MAG: DUF4157 domain-containing protein [Butyricicoccus sp.]|nr:DUF4157 domain-containing protein [Butyricicoccus sp.]
MHTNAEQKKIQPARDAINTVSQSDAMARETIPNSAMASLMGQASSGYATPDLESRMMARVASVQERPQAQIPQAENEADRLSSAISAGTPESVKSVMGQRMGADFSGVRFHTGAAAAAKADAMGARAYTSGADVYFGSDGFDPSVAAHELVHTAQQGMVDSGVATMSTPVGGVQMEPLTLKNRSFTYRKDMEYQTLVKLVGEYNKASGDDKARLEMAIMDNASRYIQKHSTGEKAKHKGRTANLENLIYQLSTQNGSADKAVKNVAAMRGRHADGTITEGLSALESGVTTGQMMGQKLSPAMQAIMTETLASNDKTVLQESTGNGFHLSHDVAGGSMLNVNTRRMHDASSTAALLHEMTHAQIYNTYGSTIAATEEQRRNSGYMQQEEKRRTHLMQDGFKAAILADMDRPDIASFRAGLSSVAGAKITYGLDGGVVATQEEQAAGDDAYLSRAIAGATDERTAVRNNAARADWDRYVQSLEAHDSMRRGNLGGAQDESKFTRNHGAAMIEHDPAIVEHLMNFELNTQAQNRDKSQAYRILKAEALRGHAARHNAILQRRLQG